jgi:hypothetical protein
MKATTETATGLRVDITIECETEQEVISHLQAMLKEYKAHLKETPEIKHTIQIHDQNCYGEHLMIINLDK